MYVSEAKKNEQNGIISDIGTVYHTITSSQLFFASFYFIFC